MDARNSNLDRIPSWHLYGEERAFPDVLHCERITDRAAGLDWVISPHRHPHLHQFFLVCAGDVEMHADGQVLTPATPCIMSIPKGTVHGFTFSADTDGYVVTIPVQSLPEIFDPKSQGVAALSRFAILDADTGLADLFDALHDEHERRLPGRIIMLRAQASTLACQIARALPANEELSQFGRSNTFKHFATMAESHFRDGWQPKDYAKALNISTRHLGRICQSATGQSPSEYLENILMQEACRLLVYTRDTISAIGYHLGFEDPSYFSRAFRRNLGMTPRNYRSSFEKE